MSKVQKDKVVALATQGEIQVLLLSPEAVVYGKSSKNRSVHENRNAFERQILSEKV